MTSPGLVAVPCMDWLYTHSVRSLLELSQAMPAGSQMILGQDSTSAAANRNEMTERFLNNPEWEWILYVDSDMTVPTNTISRLLARNVDFIGAMCFKRSAPYMPTWQELDGRNEIPMNATGVREVKMSPTGCLMVQRKVIEAMPYPWFEHPAPGTGEDVMFCDKARELGFKIFLDCDVGMVGHVTPQLVDRNLARIYHSSASVRRSVAESQDLPFARPLLARCFGEGAKKILDK